MESIEFLNRLLNFGSDWEIKDIIVNENFKEIDIFIEYSKSTGICPSSKEESTIYDFRTSRRFRHLDLFEYKTFINARIPRVINKKKEVNSIEISWAGERVSYTYLFESKVIDALKMSKNQTKTADFFDTTFDIVHGIMERAVVRGLDRRKLDGISAISLDEKSIKNGQNYITILSDPVNKCVLDIIEGRKKTDTEELLTWTISPSQLNNINLVTMDMWRPYMKAVEEIIPQADIAHDKFHTSKYLNKAVDDVRKKEVKNEEILKKTKYIFLKNKESWTELQVLKFKEINQVNLVTSKAWHLKENFKGIYQQGRKELCLDYFKQWYLNTLETGIKQMIKVADTMLKHLKGVVNSAVTHITNSMAENLNSQIQVVKSIGRGFANVNGYRNSILFFQGNLLLYPF
jgi:transposase